MGEGGYLGLNGRKAVEDTAHKLRYKWGEEIIHATWGRLQAEEAANTKTYKLIQLGILEEGKENQTGWNVLRKGEHGTR